MTYATVDDVKHYGGVESGVDDALIEQLIGAAQSFVENYTGRLFEAAADTTRVFDSATDVLGRKLYLDHDLAAITEVVTDADSNEPLIVPSGDIRTYPRTAPYWAIEIKPSSEFYWRYSSNASDAIEITGRWAYSITPPDDIKHATIRLATYFYKAKDAQVFDTTAMLDAGVMTIPQGIPKDVKLILDNYKRPEL